MTDNILNMAIENNTLSLEQVTDVINGKRVIAPLQDIREVGHGCTDSGDAGRNRIKDQLAYQGNEAARGDQERRCD